MASVSLTKSQNGIELSLNALLTRGKAISSYLNRVTYPAYQQAQIERWTSENSSQGDTWKPLLPEYQKQKRKKFASYPGSGNALMVATGRLASGAQGSNPAYAYKIITDDSMTVGVNGDALPYAQYVGVMRPYLQFSDATIQEWTGGIAQYIMNGVGL